MVPNGLKPSSSSSRLTEPPVSKGSAGPLLLEDGEDVRVMYERAVNESLYPPCVGSGEKQAATHVSLDQEYDVELANMWRHLEEQLVASTNKGVVPLNFQPSQYCLNSQTDNLPQPLAVMGGTRVAMLCPHCHPNLRPTHSRCLGRTHSGGADVPKPLQGFFVFVEPLASLEVHPRRCGSI